MCTVLAFNEYYNSVLQIIHSDRQAVTSTWDILGDCVFPPQLTTVCSDKHSINSEPLTVLMITCVLVSMFICLRNFLQFCKCTFHPHEYGF